MTGIEDAASRAERIDRATASAARALYPRQRADGSWCDTLPSAAVATASSVIALLLADPDGSRDLVDAALEWLRLDQAADGGWGEGPGAPATINATAMAVAAFTFAAHLDAGGAVAGPYAGPADTDPEYRYAEAVRLGWAGLDRLGGLDALADTERAGLGPICQQYLALSGLYDERRIVRIPIELSRFPAFIRRRFCFSFVGLMSWGLMQCAVRDFGPLRRALNRACAPRALAFLREVARFEGPEGGFEESPLMVALVCIGLARAGVGRDVVEHCVGYLRRTVRRDGSWAVTRDLEFTVTALLAVGLREAGQQDEARLERAARWMGDCQMDRPFPPTGAPAGGWQWSQPSGWPGTLDTADGVDALSAFPDRREHTDRGVRWLREMQNADGSWSYFCRNSRLPVDSPCSLMTAHAVIALHEATGMTAADAPIARAVRWFARTADADGALSTAWYTGLTAGTGSALAALGRVGLAGQAATRGPAGWLLRHQNPDGGWGDGLGGRSTVEETCWALLGLADGAGPEADEALTRGTDWLLERQGSGGTALWAPAYVGVYIDDLLFASDHFANGYALQALGRVRKRLASAAGTRAEGAGTGLSRTGETRIDAAAESAGVPHAAP